VYEQKKIEHELRNIRAQQEAHDAMLVMAMHFLIAKNPDADALRATLRTTSAYEGFSPAKKALARLAKATLAGA
jgi:hypothetical protein